MAPCILTSALDGNDDLCVCKLWNPFIFNTYFSAKYDTCYLEVGLLFSSSDTFGVKIFREIRLPLLFFEIFTSYL